MFIRRVLVIGALGLLSCKRGPGPVASATPSVPQAEEDTEPSQKPTERQGISPGDRRILDGGVAAMKAGDFEKARLIFAGLLDRYPDDAEVQGLHADALEGLEKRKAQREAMRPVQLPKVAFRHLERRDAPVQQSARPPKLVQVSKTRNEIIDTERWFQDNGLSMPLWEVPNPRLGKTGNLPPWIPHQLDEAVVVEALRDPAHPIAMYAEDYSGGQVLLVFDTQGEVVRALDFTAWSRTPKDLPKDREFSEQRVHWAMVRDGVLFVSTGHNTYAKSSGGLTGFITALDLESAQVLWRSEPLVANAANFVYRDGYILTGYGFTAEPDFMYVLDAKTGKTASKTRVKSGPSYILESGDQLFVRTYDTNYVFEIR